MTRIAIVTGGLGFIGKNFVDRAWGWSCYDKIYILDKCSFFSDIEFFHRNLEDKATLVIQDINTVNEVSLSSLCGIHQADIFHFAAESHVDRSFENSLDFTINNTQGTHNLLNALRGLTNCRLIMVSTDEVYGEVTEESIPEEGSLRPTNPYSASKAAADILCQTYMTCFGIDCKIVRPNNIFGPRQHIEKLIPKAIHSGRRGERFIVHGDGSQERSFLHVNDLSDAIRTIIETWHSSPHRVFNIESDERWRVIDLVKYIYRKKNRSTDLIIEGLDRPFNDRAYHVDGSKIRDLGWIQKESLLDTVDYLLDEDTFLGYGFEQP